MLATPTLTKRLTSVDLNPGHKPYQPYGAAVDLMYSHAPEVLIAGPAGTGKSRACLEKLHLCAMKYARMRAVMVRKTRKSLTQSGMVTFREHVLHEGSGVHFYTQEQEYRYPNGSVIVVAGLDQDGGKVMSAEYDLAYIQEATEVSESEFENLTTRLRNGQMPYQQLIADCNPSSPTHWLKLRVDKRIAMMLESRHEDNPQLWDGSQWTTRGRAYIANLDRLTGVRKLRLRLGLWAAAEGMVYENFDRNIHLIDRFEIPFHWRRIRVIDFGYTNPFVCAWYALDADGRMYLYREIYMTQRLVTEHVQRIRDLSRGERIEATIADPEDAEGRATLRRNGLDTIPALKAVRIGIQTVQSRWKVAGDGKPRLFLMRDSLVEADERLIESKKPLCTEQEIEGYVYPKGVDGKPVKEEPVKLDDHGCDCLRYAALYIDRPRREARSYQG